MPANHSLDHAVDFCRATRVPDDDGSNLPPLEITATALAALGLTTTDLTKDPGTMAYHLIELARRLGIVPSVKAAQLFLMVERDMDRAEADRMPVREIVRELRVAVNKRGLLGDNLPEADHQPKGTLELKPVKAGQGDTGISLAVQKAGASLEWVRRERPDLTPTERSDERYTKDEYDYIAEQGYDAYPEDDKGRSTVPNWDTWARYVREYLKHTQGPVNAPRAGRPIGRSVSRQADV